MNWNHYTWIIFLTRLYDMQNKIPNHFSQIVIVSKYELIKYVRGKKIHAMLGIAIIIPILLILIPEFLDSPDPEKVGSYLTTLLGVIFFIQVILVAFFGSGTLVSEFHDKTGYALFPNPILRTSIWIGKFIASTLISFFVIGCYYLVISIAAFYKYQSLPNEVFLSLSFSLVVITSLMGFAFLTSSIFRSSVGAVVTMIFLFIIILPMIDQLLMTLAETKPWYSPTFSSGIIKNILTVPYPIDLALGELPRGPFDFERFVPYVEQSLPVLALYSFVCGLCSLLLFRNKEMK